MVESLTRYWTNRPGGDSARADAGSVCSADQSDQVSSGSPTLPVRTCTVTEVPAGRSARHVSAPKRLRAWCRGRRRRSSPWLDVSRGEPDDRAGIARPQQDSPSGSGQKRQDLAVIELGERA